MLLWSDKSGLTCKPHSVRQAKPAWMIICLRGLPEAAGVNQPGELPVATKPPFDLAPERGCPAIASLQIPVVSYTTISPLPLRAVCFCGPIRQVTPSRDFPGFVLYGVRTFLDMTGMPRSSGQPGMRSS